MLVLPKFYYIIIHRMDELLNLMFIHLHVPKPKHTHSDNNLLARLCRPTLVHFTFTNCICIKHNAHVLELALQAISHQIRESRVFIKLR